MPTPLPPAATPRSQSLTVPATQNTAPVIKFRCLYTHDVRRKAKRWQDGFLRYHTFNKRVMVFDNNGYFIGDVHWRQDEGIQDGDELELDKGALIQVCEPLERTETDISLLYNQNKTQGPQSRPGDAPAYSVRSSVSSQQASRSLNDLLGIRKTFAPQLSPYEQRHRQDNNTSLMQQHERPAKRQRIAPPETVSRPPQPDVVDLSGSPPRAQTAPRTGPPTVMPTECSRDAGATNLHNPSPAGSVSQDSRPMNSNLETPTSTLRLPKDKPRRKLMYQEAFATQTSQTKTPLSRTQSPSQASADYPTAKDEATSSPTVIVIDDDDPFLEPLNTVRRQSESSLEDLISAPSKATSGHEMGRGNARENTANSDRQYSTPSVVVIGHQPSKPVTSTTAPPKQSGPDTNSNALLQENPVKSRSSGLRKPYSDPTAISHLHNRHLSATTPLNPPTENPDEQGPWTSEALDLFDFWPPGRPKPT